MVKVSVVLFVLAVSAAIGFVNCASPPSADCSTVIFNLADCLSYVSNGSTISKPQGSCCSGLKTVLKTNPECLCEAFKNSAQFGVTLNQTKAVELPAACGVSTPISNCGLPGGAPSPAPANSPKTPSPSPKSPKAAPSPSSPSPSSSLPVTETPATSPQASNPGASAPGQSGASAVPISFMALFLGLLIAYF